jgi:hypothetical protein
MTDLELGSIASFGSQRPQQALRPLDVREFRLCYRLD